MIAERAALPLGSDDVRTFVDHVTDLLEAPSTPSRRQTLIIRRWVVRNDDIDLIRHLLDGIAVAGVSHSFSSGPTVPSITGAAVALFQPLRALYSKGVRLSGQDLLVLMHLKRFGPMTEHELRNTCAAGSKMTREELRGVLARLGRVTVRNGTVVALVEQDGDKRWTTAC